MKRTAQLAIVAILITAHSVGVQADEECIFTDPGGSSPVEVYDSAVYEQWLSSTYVLVWAPSSWLRYAAETNDEDPYPCLLGGTGLAQYPYALPVDVISPIRLDIYGAARSIAHSLPWPCPQQEICLAFGSSTVAAVPPEPNDIDVAFYIARYVFVTVLM